MNSNTKTLAGIFQEQKDQAIRIDKNLPQHLGGEIWYQWLIIQQFTKELKSLTEAVRTDGLCCFIPTNDLAANFKNNTASHELRHENAPPASW